MAIIAIFSKNRAHLIDEILLSLCRYYMRFLSDGNGPQEAHAPKRNRKAKRQPPIFSTIHAKDTSLYAQG